MKRAVYQELELLKEAGNKGLAVLIDPDDTDEQRLIECLSECLRLNVDFIFIGGSLITSGSLEDVVSLVKSYTDIPCVLFPGNAIQIDPTADAILFLSLISGRNPELLIGQHVVAAPVIKRSQMEVIPTGYMLVNSGKSTSASYISNTQPLPNDKPALAASTALAGEMLGLKCIYMDAGSGAENPINNRVINAVRAASSIPLIVGGGLNNVSKINDAYRAGADLIVIGNGAQKNLDILAEASRIKYSYNNSLKVN